MKEVVAFVKGTPRNPRKASRVAPSDDEYLHCYVVLVWDGHPRPASILKSRKNVKKMRLWRGTFIRKLKIHSWMDHLLATCHLTIDVTLRFGLGVAGCCQRRERGLKRVVF